MTMAIGSFCCEVTTQGVVEHPGHFAQSAGGQAAYDALESRGRRRAPPTTIVREDVNTRGVKQTRLQANANDTVRNFSVAAWAVRRHLDYVARFQFKATTPDEGLNKEIETLVEETSKPLNFDAGGRFGREKFFRLAEARRCLDGDTGVLLLSSGRVQGIEADLIRQPPESTIDRESSHEWTQGVEIDGAGAMRRLSIYGRNRGGQGYVYRKNVSAANMMLYGFFARYASEQPRGISPIVASLNNYRDLYENFDYALARAKLNQLFALALTRKASAASLGAEFPDPDGDEDEDADPDANKPREIDLSGGPTILDLDDGETAQFLESSTPSDQFQAFTRLICAVALKSLDIPYSFYDEAYTNYSGQRNAWLIYERACIDPRDDQREMRRRWTVFQLQRWIATGQLRLPRGKSIGDLSWLWTPLGIPWWKPSEELTADLKSIAAGLQSPQRICQLRDLGDPMENLRQTAEFFKYAEDIGNQILGRPIRPVFDADFLPEVPEPTKSA